MNQQKKLIAIFRSFVQKALIPQVKRNEGSIQEWNRFSSLLSNESINLNELQNYVESLPSIPLHVYTERKELSLGGRRRDQNSNYVEKQEEPFSANKTFGGERSKHLVAGLRNVQTQVKAYETRGQGFREVPHSKDFSQGKEYGSRDDSFRRGGVPSSMQSIGGSPSSYQPVSIINSLDRLLKQLLQNQHKIDTIEGKSY